MAVALFYTISRMFSKWSEVDIETFIPAVIYRNGKPIATSEHISCQCRDPVLLHTYVTHCKLRDKRIVITRHRHNNVGGQFFIAQGVCGEGESCLVPLAGGDGELVGTRCCFVRCKGRQSE